MDQDRLRLYRLSVSFEFFYHAGTTTIIPVAVWNVVITFMQW